MLYRTIPPCLRFPTLDCKKSLLLSKLSCCLPEFRTVGCEREKRDGVVLSFYECAVDPRQQ